MTVCSRRNKNDRGHQGARGLNRLSVFPGLGGDGSVRYFLLDILGFRFALAVSFLVSGFHLPAFFRAGWAVDCAEYGVTSATGAEAEFLAAFAQTLLVISSVLFTLLGGFRVLPVVLSIRRVRLLQVDLEGG